MSARASAAGSGRVLGGAGPSDSVSRAPPAAPIRPGVLQLLLLLLLLLLLFTCLRDAADPYSLGPSRAQRGANNNNVNFLGPPRARIFKIIVLSSLWARLGP